MSNFRERLLARQRVIRSCVCVGIDPEPEKLAALAGGCGETARDKLLEFGQRTAAWTQKFACVFKPNMGFFLNCADGPAEGMKALEMLIAYIRTNFPDIPIILDFKANDIGNSAKQYAEMAFKHLKVDAVTINPYLGSNSVLEFLRLGGAFVLCRTSNESAKEFQGVCPAEGVVGEPPLFLRVASQVAEWRKAYPDCGLVAGATYPDDIPKITAITGDAPLLIPGIGKQKGDLEVTIRNAAGAKASDRLFVINSSSGIIFANDPAKAAEQLRDQINALLPAGFYD